MEHERQHYVNGGWVDPLQPTLLDVVDPSTEEAFTKIAVGGPKDVDRAVAAAKAAFPSFARTSRKDRLDLLKAILSEYNKRRQDIAETLSREMGAPLKFAFNAQSGTGTSHLTRMIQVLETYKFEDVEGSTLIAREPIGVVGLITPWNWPINQIVCKVAPGIAAGCTMVLKPSEVAPLNAIIWSEVMHAAGVPAGVYNMVQGEGGVVGEAMSSHPDIDMMSFTGSTRAGILVAQAAAKTVKRVSQELGGKSANILLPDVDFQTAVTKGVLGMMGNSGQSCNAPTRMFVPADRHEEVKAIAKAAAERVVVGNVADTGTTIGPVVSEVQFNKIQRLIQAGIDEGAEVVTGGPGRPENLNRGYFVRPTVFAGVRNDMTIAREEIFGPVLAILPYKDEADAVRLANETVYGLAAYVQSGDIKNARRVAAEMRRQRLRELSGQRHRRAIRWLQAVRQRPRIRQMGVGRLHLDQGGDRLRSRLMSKAAGGNHTSMAIPRRALLGGLLALPAGLAEAQPAPVQIYAAMTFRPALERVLAAYRDTGGTAVAVYAPTPVLIHQLAAGAPADILLTADPTWMNEAVRQKLVRPDSRKDLMTNDLVLAGPAGSPIAGIITRTFALTALLRGGRLAMCDPDNDPAGRYAKQSLQALGFWPAIQPRIAIAETSLAAVVLVDNGEAAAAACFKTDLHAAARVIAIGAFPPETHAPIVYPIALASEHNNAQAPSTLAFLRSPTAMRIFAGFGYAPAT